MACRANHVGPLVEVEHLVQKRIRLGEKELAPVASIAKVGLGAMKA